MTAGKARRDELVETLADHVLAHGLAEASLRSLGEAAGTSDRMLLYYFKDKADLVEAVLTSLSRRLTPLLVMLAASERLETAQLDRRTDTLFTTADALRPYAELFCELSLLAGRGDAAVRPYAERMGRSLFGWLMGQLAGRPGDSAAHAAQLMMAQFGRQILRAANLGDLIDLTHQT